MNTKTKVAAAFLTIFLVGAASGYLLHDVLPEKNNEITAERFERERRGFSGDRERGRVRIEARRNVQNRLAGQLELDQNQQEAFFEKMEIYRSGLRSNMRDVRQREAEMFRKYYHNFRDDLTDLLSEEQLENLDRIMHPDSVRNRGFGRR